VIATLKSVKAAASAIIGIVRLIIALPGSLPGIPICYDSPRKHAPRSGRAYKSPGPPFAAAEKYPSDRYGMMSRLLRTREFRVGLWIKFMLLLTPRILVGRIPIHDRVGLTFGVGEQVAVTFHRNYNHKVR
jgi:hypothetical protein